MLATSSLLISDNPEKFSVHDRKNRHQAKIQPNIKFIIILVTNEKKYLSNLFIIFPLFLKCRFLVIMLTEHKIICSFIVLWSSIFVTLQPNFYYGVYTIGTSVPIFYVLLYPLTVWQNYINARCRICIYLSISRASMLYSGVFSSVRSDITFSTLTFACEYFSSGRALTIATLFVSLYDSPLQIYNNFQ